MQEAIIFAANSRTQRMDSNAGSIKIHNADSSVMFERTFKEHFKGLHAYACSILRNEADAEEMVQNVFYKLWEKKERLKELDSVAAYLYRAVYNECMNHVKHQKVKNAYKEHTEYRGEEHTGEHDSAGMRELEAKIGDALQALPEQCRTIFQMSRFEELKYREIAEKLGLSVKTIENQMGKALKIMRTRLAEYVTVLWLLFINLLN